MERVDFYSVFYSSRKDGQYKIAQYGNNFGSTVMCNTRIERGGSKLSFDTKITKNYFGQISEKIDRSGPVLHECKIVIFKSSENLI